MRSALSNHVHPQSTGIDSPSLYRWSPFGALMYIQPRSPLQAAHCRSATVCLPVLFVSFQVNSTKHVVGFPGDMKSIVERNAQCQKSTHINFRSSRFPSTVLIVEFIRLICQSPS